MAEYDKKSDDLEAFLERQLEQNKGKDGKSQDGESRSDIVWDAAKAAVEYGAAQTMTEATEAVVQSDAFSHIGEDAQVVVRKAAKEKREQEMVDGMAPEFRADSLMAGAAQAEPEPDDYLFSAVKTSDPPPDEDEMLFGGGGSGDDDDDPNKKTGKAKDAEADKKADKKKADKAAKKAAKKAKKAAAKSGSKPKK